MNLVFFKRELRCGMWRRMGRWKLVMVRALNKLEEDRDSSQIDCQSVWCLIYENFDKRLY